VRMCASRSCRHRALFKSGPDWREAAEIELAQHGENLGVENRCTGRAAHRVVREKRELPVEDRARTQASNGGRHAVAAMEIKLRLRARVALDVGNRMQRSRRQVQALMAPSA